MNWNSLARVEHNMDESMWTSVKEVVGGDTRRIVILALEDPIRDVTRLVRWRGLRWADGGEFRYD